MKGLAEALWLDDRPLSTFALPYVRYEIIDSEST